MGSFLTNYQVRGASSSAVVQAMRKLAQSRAYVSPEKNGWVTVYDETSDSQDQDVLTSVAENLSRALKTDVFAFLVHDSDIAVYWLYKCGKLADEFNSAPDYFSEYVDDATRSRLSGKVDAILPLCVAGTTRAQLEAVLHSPDGPPPFAEDLITDLANLLGIDDTRASLGFEYFDNEGEGILPDIGNFTPIGRGAERKTANEPSTEEASAEMAMDPFPLAIGMLVQSWNKDHQNVVPLAGFMTETEGNFLEKIRSGFDRYARDFLKRSALENLPSLDELKAARDKGPDALAKLLAQRVPNQLPDIGFQAILNRLEEFVTALLNQGMDPNATASAGRTLMSAAEQHGKNSKIYQLLKSAADKRK